jgi:hypothetical protein
MIQRVVRIAKRPRGARPGQIRFVMDPIEVTDWIFQHIGRRESEMYPPTHPGLRTLCDDGRELVLDEADPKGSFARLQKLIDPVDVAVPTDALDAMTAEQRFKLTDWAEHVPRPRRIGEPAPTDLPTAAMIAQWNGFLDSFDRKWGHLDFDAKRAGKADHRSLLKFVSLILRTYEELAPVFVGIGASAEVVMEVMRQDPSRPRVATIPISTVKLDVYNQAATAEAARVETYVQSCLGRCWSEEVDLVLLDATESGDTLMVLQRVIEAHDKRDDLARDVITASLSATAAHPERDTIETIGQTGIEIIKSADRDITTLQRLRFYAQNETGYKTVVGRIYSRANNLKAILTGQVTAPIGYDRDAHLRVVEFVHFLKDAAKAAAKAEERARQEWLKKTRTTPVLLPTPTSSSFDVDDESADSDVDLLKLL